MVSPDGRYAITYNGEIYNYRELKVQLQTQGAEFHSESDTEVLLWAYIVWGPECLHRLNGMFAFAVYDQVRNSLFCARDCFGIKPLFYTQNSAGFAFASEIQALLECPGVSRRLNWQATYDYLQFCAVNVGQETMIEGIRHLPPAHSLEVDVTSGEVRTLAQYWKPNLSETRSITYPDAIEQLRELLLDSFRLHLRSDVPIGIAVSGGLDSSAIACGIRRLEPTAEINTFSFIARDSEYSEERWIHIVNEAINARAHAITVAPDDIVADVDKLIVRQGEPVSNTAMYAQFRVFRLARDCGVTVTLDGQGGDELLGGYDGYPHARVRSLLRRGDVTRAWKLLRAQSQWPGRSGWRAVTRIVKEIAPPRLLAAGASMVGRSMRPVWLRVGNCEQHGVQWRYYYQETSWSEDMLRKSLAADATWRGLPNLLRYGDRSSMTWSIESRVPFCSRPIADFVFSLPEDHLAGDDGTSKRLLRDSMKGIVPEAIINRRDKIGFGTPESVWMRSLRGWVTEILHQGGDSKVLDTTIAALWWDEMVGGRRPYSILVWRWVNYLRWRSLLGIEE